MVRHTFFSANASQTFSVRHPLTNNQSQTLFIQSGLPLSSFRGLRILTLFFFLSLFHFFFLLPLLIIFLPLHTFAKSLAINNLLVAFLSVRINTSVRRLQPIKVHCDGFLNKIYNPLRHTPRALEQQLTGSR